MGRRATVVLAWVLEGPRPASHPYTKVLVALHPRFDKILKMSATLKWPRMRSQEHSLAFVSIVSTNTCWTLVSSRYSDSVNMALAVSTAAGWLNPGAALSWQGKRPIRNYGDLRLEIVVQSRCSVYRFMSFLGRLQHEQQQLIRNN